MNSLSLLTISGSLRRDSLNRKLIREAALHFGAEPIIADLNLPLFDGDIETSSGIPPKVQELADQISSADAVVISTPEYNQALSGVLKNALDWVSRTKGKPWYDKPVAVMSAAAGRTGGARAQYSLRLALTPFQPRLLTGPEVMVAGAAKEFDASGSLVNERYLAALKTLMSKLREEARRS